MRSFWRFIETRASRQAVLAEWKHVAGAHFPVIKPLLTPTDQIAESYPALDTRMHQPRVVDYGDGTLAAVCSRDADLRVALSAGDIVLYALNPHLLRKMLCDALAGLVIAKTGIDSEATIHLGNWEPKKAAAFPALLMLCRTRSLLRQRMVELATSQSKPGAIVLTPTRANWDDDIQAMARSKRQLLVAVEEVLDVTDGSVVQASGWNEYLAAFCQMVGTTLPANYHNKKRPARRSQRATNIEKLEKAIEDHLLSAKKHAFSLREQGRDLDLLPRPEQKFLAAQLGMTTAAVSRCLNDPNAQKLKILWEAAESLEAVLRFKR